MTRTLPNTSVSQLVWEALTASWQDEATLIAYAQRHSRSPVPSWRVRQELVDLRAIGTAEQQTLPPDGLRQWRRVARRAA